MQMAKTASCNIVSICFLENELLRLSIQLITPSLKLWCLQFGLLPRIRWPLPVYEVTISEVEKCERITKKAAEKWLEVPRFLSTVTLYGKGIFGVTNEQLGGGVQECQEPGDDFVSV